VGRPRKQPGDTNLSDTGTSSKQARLDAEAERQAAARAERTKIVKETKDAQKATANFLAAKPTDTRHLNR
jgi:hypothetical protein